MKVWVKLLIGSILGFVLGTLLPSENTSVAAALDFLYKLVLGAGRYTAAPIVVFSLTIGIYELRQDGCFWKLLFRSFLVLITGSVFVIGLGMAVTLIFSPDRIPILIDEQAGEIIFNSAQNILDIFPSNMLTVFAGDGKYLFPFCVLAFAIAIGLGYDRNYTKPVLALIDSLSRIFFHIATLFSEIFAVLIIVLSAYWSWQYKNVVNISVFTSVMRLLLIFSLILTLLVFPLFLYFLKHNQKPWKTLYGILAPAISAFFSGDMNFNIPILLMHLKENLGIRRRSSAVTVSLWSTFGRCGSAMVASVAFIVILKSYSSLDIGLVDVISIGVRALLISFLLARNSADAAYMALAVLCMQYGRGFENGYLILKPVAFYLIAVGAFLDVVITALGSFIVASLSGFMEERPVKKYI
ncbi:transporter [Spirochaetia bacterium]|nr:transporter [Spirochaetia bacterium]